MSCRGNVPSSTSGKSQVAPKPTITDYGWISVMKVGGTGDEIITVIVSVLRVD